MESKKLQKKSHSAEKNPSEKHQGGILCFRGSGRRYFCFGRGSGVPSMFWTPVVQVDDVEQMNKKGPIALNWRKQTSHCKSRAFSSKTPTKNKSFLHYRKGRDLENQLSHITAMENNNGEQTFYSLMF